MPDPSCQHGAAPLLPGRIGCRFRDVAPCNPVLSSLILSCLVLCVGGPAEAQEPAAAFPSRPVTLVVPAQPGASFDVTARLYSQKLGESLRQPVVLEHRPGAGGTIAYASVAKAPANGYRSEEHTSELQSH